MADWSKITSRGQISDRRGTTQRFGLASGGLTLVVFVIVSLFNAYNGGQIQINPSDVLSTLQNVQTSSEPAEQPPEFAGVDQYEEFVSTVLGSNNDLWRNIFQQAGKTYTDPTLVLFRGGTNSGCGFAAIQVGPHYCPADQTIYLDETFFDELRDKYGGSSGDVAQAYVIAHEVGHHVQNQLGVMDEVLEEQQRNSSKANDLSVQLELQADCFAGVWANSIKQVFEEGEINEALAAAAAVGDDRIQEKIQGYSNPETWTHGSSAERIDWFNRGFTSGQPSTCNTF